MGVQSHRGQGCVLRLGEGRSVGLLGSQPTGPGEGSYIPATDLRATLSGLERPALQRLNGVQASSHRCLRKRPVWEVGSDAWKLLTHCFPLMPAPVSLASLGQAGQVTRRLDKDQRDLENPGPL